MLVVCQRLDVAASHSFPPIIVVAFELQLEALVACIESEHVVTLSLLCQES